MRWIISNMPNKYVIFLFGLITIMQISAVPTALSAQQKLTGRILHVSLSPLTGVTGVQFRSISEAAKEAKAGDTVEIHGGTYRETVAIENSGTLHNPIRFVTAPGEHVVVAGADRITNWKKESQTDSIYSTDWDHEFIGWAKNHSYAALAPIGRVEQVFVDNYSMHQVMMREYLNPGSFYIDEKQKRLYIWIAENAYGLTSANIENLNIEASTRNMLWNVKGDYVSVKGIKFRYAANHAQMGAVTFEGSNNILENCTVERTNGTGARFEGKNIIVRSCLFQDNGFVGFEACRAHNLRMTDCCITNNNTKNFDRGWGGAGNKIVLSRNVILEKCRFIANRGVGIWFDIGNENCTVRNCLIADNENSGLFYEISYGLHAYDNVITGNGFAGGYGSWGVTGGITLSSSPNCVIERNLLIGNAEGFSFREQLRTTPTIDNEKKEIPVWNHHQKINNNVLAYNNTQAWGWFAVGDGRQWLRSMRKATQSSNKPEQDMAADYVSKDNNAQPTDLALEDLNIDMSGNLYYAAPGQGLVNWGPSWEDHKVYANLNTLHEELGLEKGSRCVAPNFADTTSRDFRVPANNPAVSMGCYPKGDVPGVKLGVVK
ncbi:MAG: right-handed parallel beta-helix repeat-containing protein [Armatimonadota bacterium]